MRSAALALALLGLPLSAEAQASRQADQILGVWKCQAGDQDSPSTSTVTYLAGGKQTAELAMKVGEPLNLEVFASTAGDWTLDNGVLTETVTAFKYTGGRKNGRPTAPGFLETVVGQPPLPYPPSSYPVEINGDTMVLKGSDGAIGTRCTR